MKKINFFTTLLVAAGLIVSCSSEKRLDTISLRESSTDALQFKISDSEYVEGTRAITSTTNSIRGGHFNLVAKGPVGGTFNHKMLVASDGSKATIADATPPTYYWPVFVSPGTIDMKFIGLYPHKTTGWTANTTTPSLITSTAYTVSTTFASTEDLLYLYKSVTSRSAAIPAPITLEFQHALVKVTFTLKLTSNSASSDVYVKGITLSNLKNTGTCTLNPTTTSATPATIWSSQGGAASVALTGLTKSSQATVFSAVNATTPANIFNSAWASGDHYILMPVNDHPQNVAVSITLNVAGTDYTKTITLPKNDTELTTLGINTAAERDARKWYPGRWINYALEFNVDKEGGELLFGGITVAPWGARKDIPIPLN
ncbi:fimbrillin family protein [Alistipes sp. OttesenSCG-928-B03]|nr:fimbrillin family protein [Alistipes sp. OttesenSCG-928-B03]